MNITTAMSQYHQAVKDFYEQLGHPLRAIPIMQGDELPPNAQSVYNLALEILLSEKCQNLRIAKEGSDEDPPKEPGFVYSSPGYWEETNGLLNILSNCEFDLYSFSTMFRYCRSGILQSPYTIGYLMEKSGVDSNRLTSKNNHAWIKLEDMLSNITVYWDEIVKYNKK